MHLRCTGAGSVSVRCARVSCTRYSFTSVGFFGVSNFHEVGLCDVFCILVAYALCDAVLFARSSSSTLLAVVEWATLGEYIIVGKTSPNASKLFLQP